MSHQSHGDDPNEYPSGNMTPGTVVALLLIFAFIIWRVYGQ